MKGLEPFRNYLLHLFDIKEGELKKTLLLQLNIFLIITTLLIVKPTVNSLFLSELTSDALPLGYVLTAIAAVIGSHFYTKGLEKKSLNRIIELTLYGSIISLILFGLAFKFQIAKGWLLYIPYIWVAIFGLLAASQFWILANLVYNIREAKRIFGFIGAGAIAGGIFGGYVTSILTRFMSAEDLFFVAAFILSVCIPIVRYIWDNEVLKLSAFQLSKRTDVEGENPIKIIRKSKLLSLIAVVIGLSVLVAKLVDYQYSDYASKLIEDPEKLASFFGFWFSTLSVVSLLVQLFLTKKIVGMFGVGRSLLWLPGGILIGSIVLLLIPQLWVIVFIKVVDGSLKQSVNKAATELLSIPIPIEIKKKTKTFIDVVVDSIATGMAGFILIFFINGLDLSAQYVSLIIITLICIWIYLILQLKNEYISAFRDLFTDAAGKKKKSNKTDIPVSSIVHSVKKVLSTGSENQIIYMLNKTLEVKDNRFFYEIFKLLEHPSAKIRALAVENLYFLNVQNLSHKIEPMIYDKDQEVTTAAFRYLLKFHDNDPVVLFDQYLESEDATIANAALLGLSLELRNHEKLQEKFRLIKRIEKALQQLDDLKDPNAKKHKTLVLLQAIGNAKVSWHYSFIDKHLLDEDIDIAAKAIHSASLTLDSNFIDPIIDNLSRKDHREAAIEALVNYGENIIDVLFQKIVDQQVKLENARYIPAVMEHFASQKAVRALVKLVDITEHEIKIEAIEALQRLKWKDDTLEIKNHLIVDKILDECELYQHTLGAIHSQIVVQYKKQGQEQMENEEEREARLGLIKLLETRLDRQLRRIFKFLGMKYPPTDIDPVFEVIRTGKEEQRIHAIEFLDNILDVQLKKQLIPIAEASLIDAAYDEKIKKLNIKIPSELECFKSLLNRNDNKLKLAVLYLMEKTKDSQYVALLQDYLLSAKDPNLKQQAQHTLEILSDQKVTP